MSATPSPSPIRFRYDVELAEKQIAGVREAIKVRVWMRRREASPLDGTVRFFWYFVGGLMLQPEEWAAMKLTMQAAIQSGVVTVRELGRPPIDPDLEKRRQATEACRRAAQSAAARKGVTAY